MLRMTMIFIDQSEETYDIESMDDVTTSSQTHVSMRHSIQFSNRVEQYTIIVPWHQIHLIKFEEIVKL